MTDMNIPLKKLRHASMKKLADYCGKELPSVSHSRQIVKSVASRKLNQIQQHIAGNDFFLVSDESFYKNSKFLNVLLGKLSEPNKTYLVACKPIEQTTAEQFFKLLTTLSKTSIWKGIDFCFLSREQKSRFFSPMSAILKSDFEVFFANR